MEDHVELHENRTELEHLLADVWDYEDPSGRKTSLPRWLFAATLAGALICTLSPSDIVAPFVTALAPTLETTSVDKVSSENLDEDLDYRIAMQTKSLVGWRAFVEAHPDGPHARAAQDEIDRLLSTPPPKPVEFAEQTPTSPETAQTPNEAAQSPTPPAPPPVMVEKEPAQSSELVEVAEQPPPSLAATQTPVEAAQSPAPPSPPRATVEYGPAPPPIPAVAQDAVAASTPLPPLRPREVAVAKSEEPAHLSHSRAEHRYPSQPNVFTILAAQLFHRHRERSDAGSNEWRR
jgi:outer membrane biosynthesis protein TonB